MAIISDNILVVLISTSLERGDMRLYHLRAASPWGRTSLFALVHCLLSHLESMRNAPRIRPMHSYVPSLLLLVTLETYYRSSMTVLYPQSV